jgi:hypothetical protein
MHGKKVSEMHGLDSLSEKSVQNWCVLYHTLCRWFLGFGRPVCADNAFSSKSHNPKSDMANPRCISTGSFALGDFRNEVPGYNEQAVDSCKELFRTSTPILLHHDGGCRGNHGAQIGNDLATLRIKENDKFARLLFRLETVKNKLCELIFTCGKLNFPCDHAGYQLSFESNTADDTIHWWFGGVNFTLYRSRKQAGSWVALPIAIYARRILLNCRGWRCKVWS